MRKYLGVLFVFIIGFTFTVNANASDQVKYPQGWMPYSDVYVTWNGRSEQGNWWVDKDLNGNLEENYGCDECVDVNYNFQFKGNTLQFEEVYVDSVNAHPQSHYVVLTDTNKDGIFEGSIKARYEYLASITCPVRIDVIDYVVNPEEIGSNSYFNYIEHEFCLPSNRVD